MSQNFSDDSTNIDSKAASLRRQNFLERMERKLEFKTSIANPHATDSRYLIS